ncbi:MAG: D-alanyl-D-alanine carboxypeptidase [Spirochaetaceae bacterium]
MKKIISLIFLILLTFNIVADDFDIWSDAAILIDYDTEQILYHKNINKVIAPASMTKLVTLYMAYLAIDNNLVNKTDLVTITKNADWRNLPRDSSLMFIEKGQKVTLIELMVGLAIPSGNDAAIAIAEHLYGSVNDYLIEVNNEMTNLGLSSLKFIDSSGFADDNQITVIQFVEFCLIFLKKYPEALDELFSLESFTYPKKKNGNTSIGGITQYNHNPIIGLFPGCDGLKTGFIDKSGLNISLTAKNSTRRVIAVLSGVRDKNKVEAEYKRIYDSIKILETGLNHYINVNLDTIKLPLVKVNNGLVKFIKPIIPFKRKFTLLKGVTFNYDFKSIDAPITYGEKVGNVTFEQGGMTYQFPVYCDNEIYKRADNNIFIFK